MLNNQNLCAYVNGKPRFQDKKPSIEPTTPVPPPPKKPYELNFPSLEPKPATSNESPPASISQKPKPSATATPQKTNVSPIASKRPTSPDKPGTSPKPSHSPSKKKSPSIPASKSSVPSPSRFRAEQPSGPTVKLTPKTCFPNSATVEIESGRMVPISTLRIGDRVRTGPTSFSPVFLFTHKDSTGLNEFLRIEAASGAFVELSAGHYMLANGVLTATRNLRAGDTIALASGVNDTVMGVKTVWMEGLHNPQTIDGNIVVGGIITSTFTEAIFPSVATALLAPLRAVYYFGISGVPLKDVFYLSDQGLLDYLPKSFSSPLENYM